MIDESRAARSAAMPQHPGSGRNARAGARLAALAALGLGACGTARAAVEVPRPRVAPSAAPRALTEPATPIEIEPAGIVTGDIRFLAPPGDLDLGRVVVFLAASARVAHPAAGAGSAAPVAIVSTGETFAPPLAAVPWNRTAVLANEGPVNHRLFATEIESGRAFELPPGTRSAPFRPPPVGPIRFFCSLHADETFVLFSERTTHMAVVEGRQRFSFGPVEPGRYMLSIWSERVEGPVREILVDGYSRRTEPVWIDPRLLRSDAAVEGGER